MVAYLFPPAGGIGAAGSQRVLKFAKYLPRHCWQPVILTCKEEYYETYLSLDQTLLEKIRPGTPIIRTAVIRWFAKFLQSQKAIKTRVLHRQTTPVALGAMSSTADRSLGRGWYQCFKDTITDLFEIPDEEMGWFLPAVWAGLRAIKKESIDAIYSTGKPWTAHLIGLALQRLTRKPLIVDFRDPWMTNPFRTQYSALKDGLEATLEKRVIENASVVIANTDELREEFLRRFPRQPRNKFATLLNGFDPDDYSSETNPNNSDCNRFFTITHTGFLYGKRDPKIFLDAVRLLLEEQRVDRRKLKIFFTGSIELPYNLTEYLSANGLREVVALHDHVPHEQSLKYLLASDVLLLLQPGTKTQIPSKLFEYIGMKKPIVAISPSDGATCRLMIEEGLGPVADPDSVQEIEQVLHTLYQAWRNGSLSSTVNNEAHQKFDVRNITASLASTLSHLVYSIHSPDCPKGLPKA